MTANTIIIGAGPAGIGAALQLGDQCTLLERGHDVAGLSRTVTLDGAVFDLGGHTFHTPHEAMRDLVFGALEMEEQRREAWCWMGGQWIAYPFQKHVAALADAGQRAACLDGMATASGGAGARDFDSYLELRFGRPVADLFMRPYNRKLWGEDLTRLATEWASERVAAPAGVVEHFVESGGSRTPLQSNTNVAYPARGGFGEIFKSLARRIPGLETAVAVTAIDTKRRDLMRSDGRSMPWRRIVSTMPLPALLAIIADVPQSLIDSMATLEAISVDLVMVVLEGRGPLERQRVYCPDPDILGHKIVLNHTSSTWLRNLPRHGIQLEVAGLQGKSVDSIAAEAVCGLIRIGLIDRPSDVRRIEVMRQPLGYPVPTHSRAQIIRAARRWLAERGILLAGRFAEWDYINSDEALHRGTILGAALGEGKQPKDIVAGFV